jgi:hypothetical protein
MDPVGILTTVLVLALIGFVVYLIITYIPMPEIFKQVLMVVVAVLLILWVISVVVGGAAPLHLGIYRHG